ncbi:hypothetical protein BUY42_05560 [Staphylococcus devriesei]|uniref:hypothetical protein n=1 Tax=Staphylococcus devriesei TaxID=586733 RepID=UPI000D1D03A0|nr:hypothetical protein [Staphylococcus devriesei]PTF18816.1 hypothetical protein BUY42_05560 [Staphylococcus devriesei]
MAFEVIKWIIIGLIVIVTIAIICGLIWGSLLEERAYDKRSKKQKQKEEERNLRMARGHTDDEETYDESGTVELKDDINKDYHNKETR